MATLTIMDAARVTGVSRSQLYRYIRAGKLSRTPDGLLDTAELLRAGLPLHVPSSVSSVSSPVPSSVPGAHDATDPAVSSVPGPVPRMPSMDTASLERLIEVLQQELAAARARETQLTQMAHERETQLLHLMAQMQQQNQRLLDMPRSAPPASPQEALEATQVRRRPERPPPPQSQPEAQGGDPRGQMRRRIVALLQGYPEGLTPTEMRELLGVERSLADTCLGMLRYGLVQRVGRGRYVGMTQAKEG